MAMPMTMPTIKHGDPLTIADQLDETGVVHGHFVRSPQGKQHSAAHAFINSPSVLLLLGDILRARFPESPEGSELPESALRIVAGRRRQVKHFGFTTTPA
jgi:hypothetical protein